MIFYYRRKIIKIKKICEEKKKKLEKDDDDNNWFDVELVVTGDGGEKDKHYGGRVKLTRIWDYDKQA